ncbi:MAG: hypothetical protein AAGG48_24595 [Planctomycetota bacterium]
MNRSSHWDGTVLFQYRCHDRWPPLAWVASGTVGETSVTVQHGPGVQCCNDWFGEIVWDGDFGSADFDQSDLVYGSGARRRGDGVTFVSASHTLDRLVCSQDGKTFWISNSLPALLAVSQTSIDPLYPFYPRDFTSIIQGMTQHRRSIANASRSLRLIYHDNLRLSDSGLQIIEKPQIERSLKTYEHYREFLKQSIASCGANLQDKNRRWSLEWLGTLSTGFDSPTVCALAKSAGLREAISITSSRGGKEDAGTEIAEQLQIKPHLIDRDAWRSQHLTEVPFLASDGKGEDVYYQGAETLLKGRVVLTGYAAGAWALRERPLTELKRADQSGLSLNEYRLWAGFIHVPVPTMGLRSGGGIEYVNQSKQMSRWFSGASYDKPFCRRLLVELGVDEKLFGVEKKAASVLLFDRRSFLSPESLKDFSDYYQRLRSGRLFAHLCRSRGRSSAAMLAIQSAAALPGRFAKRVHQSLRLNELAYRDHRYDYLFGWAIERAIQRYAVPRH